MATQDTTKQQSTHTASVAQWPLYRGETFSCLVIFILSFGMISFVILGVVITGQPPVVFYSLMPLLFVVIVGISMRITYVNYQRRVRNFIQKSTVSKATIIDRWECYDEEAGRIDHWITYTYVITNQDGAEQTITLRKIIYQAYEQFEVGSTVDVRYLPDDPRTCMLEDEFQDFMRTKGKSFITPDMPRDEAGTVQKT